MTSSQEFSDNRSASNLEASFLILSGPEQPDLSEVPGHEVQSVIQDSITRDLHIKEDAAQSLLASRIEACVSEHRLVGVSVIRQCGGSALLQATPEALEKLNQKLGLESTLVEEEAGSEVRWAAQEATPVAGQNFYCIWYDKVIEQIKDNFYTARASMMDRITAYQQGNNIEGILAVRPSGLNAIEIQCTEPAWKSLQSGLGLLRGGEVRTDTVR